MNLKDRLKLFVFKLMENGYFLRELGVYNTLLCDDTIIDYIYSDPNKDRGHILLKVGFDLKSKNKIKRKKTIKMISKILVKSSVEPEFKKPINVDLLRIMLNLTKKEKEIMEPTIVDILEHKWNEYIKENENWMNFFKENWSLREHINHIVHVVKEEDLERKLEETLPYFEALCNDPVMYRSPMHDNDNLHNLLLLLGIEIEFRKQGMGNEERFNKITSTIYEINVNNYEADKILFSYEDGFRRRDDITMKNLIEDYEAGKVTFFDFFHATKMFVAGYYCEDISSYNRVRSFDLERLNMEQIKNINLKSYNKVVNLIFEKYSNGSNELSIKRVSRKMYLLLGLQKTLDIINGIYGEVDFPLLENMFGGVFTYQIRIPKFKSEPVYNKLQLKFLDFWFASSSMDPNANIKKLFSGEISQWDIPFAKMHEEWEEIYEILDGDITIDRVKNILKGGLVNLTPAREEIRGVFQFLTETPENIRATFNIHDNMVKRNASSIPKIYGNTENFEYEILDLNDPEQLIVGNLTDCCFVVKGISHSSLKHASTNKNGRIFVVRENDQIIAQSWVWRNGTTLCFDNIEKSKSKSEVNVIEAYKKAAQDIMDISINNEPKDEAINLITIGVSYTKDIYDMEKLTINNMPKPNEPDLYVDSSSQVILLQSKNFKEEKVNYFDPEARYQDLRPTIKEFDFSSSYSYKTDEVVNIINKVGYFIDLNDHINLTKEDIFDNYIYAAYSNDWYILINENNLIEYKVLKYDQRAIKEVEENLHQLKENLSNIKSNKKVRSR